MSDTSGELEHMKAVMDAAIARDLKVLQECKWTDISLPDTDQHGLRQFWEDYIGRGLSMSSAQL
jgi:hypothetical protein